MARRRLTIARVVQMLRQLDTGRLPEHLERRLAMLPRLQVIGAWIAGADHRLRLHAIGQWLGREVSP